MSRSVLVVEDDEALRRAVCEVLRDEGIDAVGVSNGAEAIDFLHAARELPRLVLLDLMMPVMDGRAFCERQRDDPRIAGVPVVVMTAGRDLARCPAPAAAVLLKPLAIDELLDAIDRFAMA